MKLEKKYIEKMLKNYELGDLISEKHIWWAFDNTVHVIKTIKGKYILKIFRKNNKKHIRLQTEIINSLSKKQLPLPKIIPNKNDELLSHYENNLFIIQEFAEGKETHKFTPQLIKNCAEILGRIDIALKNDKILNELISRKKLQSIPKLKTKKINNLNLHLELKEIANRLKKIDMEKLRKSLIHGDFHGVNVLSKNNKVTAVLDFDDAHYDFISEELAVFIAHSFVHKDKVYMKHISVAIKGYEKYFPLNIEEKKAIYYFIKYRFLASLDWTEKHKRKLKDKKKIEKINKELLTSIKSYQNFSKIELEEFLENIK